MTAETFKIKDLKTTYGVLAGLIARWVDNDINSAIRMFKEQTHSWNEKMWRSAALTASMNGISQLCHSVLNNGRADQQSNRHSDRGSDYFIGRVEKETGLNRRRLDLQKAEALLVVGELEKQGITSVVIKGLVNAYNLYPRPCLRPMADVDIVVEAAVYEKTLEAMTALGNVIIQRGILEASLCRPDNCQYPHTWSDHPENCRSIDLHCGLRSYPLGVPVTFDENYQEDCLTYTIENDRVTGLSLQDSIAVMALEITTDIYMQSQRLIKVVDLVLLLEKLSDPEELSEVLSKRGVNVLRYVYPAFVTAERLFPNSRAGEYARHFARYVNKRMKTWPYGVDHFEFSQASSHVRKPTLSLRIGLVSDLKDISAVLKRRILPQKTWSARKTSGTGKRQWKTHYIGLLKRFPAFLKRDPRRTELDVPGFE